MPSWQVAASSLKKKTISRRPTRPPRLKAKPMAGRRRQTQTILDTGRLRRLADITDRDRTTKAQRTRSDKSLIHLTGFTG